MRNSNSKAQGMTLADIAAGVGASVTGDAGTLITGAAPIEAAGTGDISFVANKAYLKHIKDTKASALILDPETACDHLPVLRHVNPYLTFARVLDLLYPEPSDQPVGIDPTAVVSPEASVDKTAYIGPLCHVCAGATIGGGTRLASSVYVGDDVTIGEDCLFNPGVRILARTSIGNRVILHPGVVIGSDGFGFAESETGLKKIKQVGWVEIEDDVEIGSNTTIDRGALGATRIGRGTKIDNLVQIAHNVVTGQHCIMVSQVGISGSTRLGNGVVLAGQVGLVGHITVGDGAQVGAQSGVAESVPAGSRVFGSPARDLRETAKVQAALRRLPDLLKRVRALEKKQAD